MSVANIYAGLNWIGVSEANGMTNLNPRAVRPLRINWRSRLNKRPWMASYWALFRNELFLIPFLGLKASSFQSSVKRKKRRKKYARVTKLLFCSNSLVKSWSTPAAGQWPPSFSYIRTAHVNWWLVYPSWILNNDAHLMQVCNGPSHPSFWWRWPIW